MSNSTAETQPASGRELEGLLQRFIDRGENDSYKRLLQSYKGHRSAARTQQEAVGLWGSQGRLMAALLLRFTGRPVCYVTAHIPDADLARDDLETLLGHPAALLPAYESLRPQEDGLSDIACERLRLCHQQYFAERNSLADGTAPVFVSSITALMQPVPEPKSLQKHQRTLIAGTEPPGGVDELLSWLVDQGYQRTERVEVVGEFAARGGIVDVFTPGEDEPVRLDFFDETIESIRTFNLDTQRSEQDLEQIAMASCHLGAPQEDTASFFEYLAADTIILLEETAQIAEVGQLYLRRVENEQGLLTPAAVLQAVGAFDLLAINRLATGVFPSVADEFSLNGQSIQRFENQQLDGLAELIETAQQQQVYLFCENSTQVQRMREIIRDSLEKDIPANLHFPLGYLHRGFAVPDYDILLIGHHELFGQHPLRRRFRRLKSLQAIDSFTDLEVDDLVVHVQHGIGRFRGLKILDRNGREEEFLAVEFARKAMIHVPAGKINLVHKYVGAGGNIALSRLGTKGWNRQKEKVAAAVEDMAADLIELAAHRNLMEGIRYPADTAWQKEFEELFPYQETLDQLTAADRIKADMQQTRPMDRLLCGDVGYGKTELALRAVFKAVEYGRQVAVLVPTTVLAQQHYRTFTERLADFPFSVEVISRFKTASEAKHIIDRAARGQLDVLIGTHRLLSADMKFKDLGLVVIDEEQRFGVAHKEKLKQIRKTVDVLTLTATPIPRTLHLALLGIRDISALETPPLDRRSIVTEVCAYDRERIRRMILHELARDGQVYFVHNRVNNILSVADTLQRLVPEARIAVAHGQMARHELEERMLDFVEQRADVLVSTTIIESGLDIPTANTLIVNDADRFGLAQLHQLRGRVGRYKHRAYAYMLLPQRRVVNPTALKRLKAIEEYSQLGSGFRIAMRDLEIRGAGNILGAEQSGHIDAVGYELYCRLLARAVKRKEKELQKLGRSDGKPAELASEKLAISTEEVLPVTNLTQLDLNITNLIPRDYIPSDRQRMDVYRRLATCSRPVELEQLEKDLKDQFGPIPVPVGDLLQLAEIRILAFPWDIRSITENKPDLIFTMHSMKQVKTLFADMPQRIRILDDQRIYLRLPDPYFDSPATILAMLRKLLGEKKII